MRDADDAVLALYLRADCPLRGLGVGQHHRLVRILQGHAAAAVCPGAQKARVGMDMIRHAKQHDGRVQAVDAQIHPAAGRHLRVKDVGQLPAQVSGVFGGVLRKIKSGQVHRSHAPDEFYDKLIAFAKKYNIIIIHDNAYSEIIYDGQIGGSFLSHEGAMEVGVEFNSLSKTYNLTGLRLSFLIGNREIVSKFKTVRSQFDYGTSFIYQKAAVAALNGPQGYVADNRAEYELRRNALVAGIKKLGLKPADVKGTMFVWAAIPDGYTNSADYVMELLNKTGVLCTPGSSFGSLGEGHVRFALVLPHEEIDNIFSNL